MSDCVVWEKLHDVEDDAIYQCTHCLRLLHVYYEQQGNSLFSYRRDIND